MKRLIIIILFITFSIASDARAEITYINCKFNEGWHQQGKKNEEAKKMPDLTISMDKEKRRIKVTNRNFEPYDIFKDLMRWSHKWSEWNDDYVLNTINGDLKIRGFNKKENWETSFYYTCDKTQKKF
jgi:hypothetical protein